MDKGENVMENKSNWVPCVGDRVQHVSWGNGTVHVIHDTMYGVYFDENFGGHFLDGTCPDGHGWWCRREELVLIGRVPEYELASVSALFA